MNSQEHRQSPIGRLTLRPVANLIARFWYWIVFRGIESQLHAQTIAHDSVTDDALREAIAEAIEVTSHDLVAARADWIATFPPGVRFTFRTA